MKHSFIKTILASLFALILFAGVLSPISLSMEAQKSVSQSFTVVYAYADEHEEDTVGRTNQDDEDTVGRTNRRGTTEVIKLQNPLKADSIEELFEIILDVILIFAVPIIVFFIIYSGFLFVTAQGNETQLTKAKNALLWTIVGGVILLGANLILTVLLETIKTIEN